MYARLDYVSLSASVFLKTADTSDWDMYDWSALYEGIASWDQITQCVCGKCSHKLRSVQLN